MNMRTFFSIVIPVFISTMVVGVFASSIYAQSENLKIAQEVQIRPSFQNRPSEQLFPDQSIQKTFQPAPTTLDEARQNIRDAEPKGSLQQERLFETRGNIIDFQTGEFKGIFTQDFSSDVSSKPQGVTRFLGKLFVFLLGLVGVSAFFMISWGGFQYATSAANPGIMSAAKEKIWGALFGLALAAGSYIILRTINPDLIEFNITNTSTTQSSPYNPPPSLQDIPPGLNTEASITGRQPGTGGAPGLDGSANPPRGGTPPAEVQQFIQQTGGQAP